MKGRFGWGWSVCQRQASSSEIKSMVCGTGEDAMVEARPRLATHSGLIVTCWLFIAAYDKERADTLFLDCSSDWIRATGDNNRNPRRFSCYC